ncbi:MAG: hypothetical protein ACLFSE_02210 [Spirochaetia bacterium]
MITIIAASVLLIVFASPILGVIALLISLYFDYNIFSFIRLQKKSYVEADEDGIACLTPSSESVYMEWKDLTCAGTYTQGKSSGLYLYAEEPDQLLIIPDEYSRLDILEETVSSNMEMKHLSVEPGTNLREKIKEHLS